jgi:hypothetical protein
MSKKLRAKIQTAIRNAHLIGPTYCVPGKGWPHQRMWQVYTNYKPKCSQR